MQDLAVISNEELNMVIASTQLCYVCLIKIPD